MDQIDGPYDLAICQKHGYYWTEDGGCPGCADEAEAQEAAQAPDPFEPTERFSICPTCGSRIYYEDSICRRCFPDYYDW